MNFLNVSTLLLLAGAAALTTAQAEPLRTLRETGPRADALGRPQGYPACDLALIRPACRVGAWSDAAPSPYRQFIAPSTHPTPLPDRPQDPEIAWRWGFFKKSIDDYMDEAPLTGLLILQDGQIVAERYQYGRKPGMPMRSFSMAKTVTALLVGIAHDKGLIRSLDDTAAHYWPEIAPSAYGQTTLRHLLRMASGVPFKELYTWTPDDDNFVWSQVLHHPTHRGHPERVVEFLNQRQGREVDQGRRFKYASIETEILGRVLLRATGQTAAQLTQAWLWEPMGAQDPAYWNLSSTDGAASFGGGFNASLRDYGRLGMLLANDGEMNGQRIVPREFVLEATDPQRQPSAFQPKVATPYLGYGYQIWLLPYKTRTFALQGIHGQTVYIQPDSKIVMVQTAVFDKPSGQQDMAPFRLRSAFWEGVLNSLGGRLD